MSKRNLSAREVANAIGIDLTPSATVRVDNQALDRMAGLINNHQSTFNPKPAMWDDSRFWNANAPPRERSQFIAIGNTINFRFWAIEDSELKASKGILRGELLRGSMYMWRSLRLALDRSEKRILKADFLENLTETDFDSMFSDDAGQNPLQVAKEDRITNLRDFGRRLRTHWKGNFHNLIQASKGSIVEFARLSKEFRAFDDSLCKLTMVNAIMQAGSGLIQFDYAPLPGIDYHLLKQVLRQGIVQVESTIAEKLEQRRLLRPEEAQDLRRMALAAFIEISLRTGVGGDVLDNVWWFNKSKCLDRDPVCEDPLRERECPFLEACERRIHLGLPLEETRYY